LGDSHVRGSEKLASILGNVFSVIGILKPNVNMGAINDYTYLKAEKLSKRDVIICGGASNVARNETNEGLIFIFKFVKLLTDTNVIVTSVPHRFDLQAESCVTKEVELFNRKCMCMYICICVCVCVCILPPKSIYNGVCWKILAVRLFRSLPTGVKGKELMLLMKKMLKVN
jgi:hypothetical protein